MPRYNENQNIGLPANFSLENGSFKLIGGTTKVQDNVTLFMAFVGWFRVYAQDFCPDIWWIFQKPVAVVLAKKTMIYGMFLIPFMKYMPFANSEKIVLSYDYADRKKFMLSLLYTYNLEPESPLHTIKYI